MLCMFLSFGFEFFGSVGRVRRSYSLSLFFISGYGVCYTPRRHQNRSPFCFALFLARHPLSVSVAVLCCFSSCRFVSLFGVSHWLHVYFYIHTMPAATAVTLLIVGIFFSHVHVWKCNVIFFSNSVFGNCQLFRQSERARENEQQREFMFEIPSRGR